MSALSEILKKRRKELNLTLLQIAEAVGVTEATVQRWESGNIKTVRHEKITKLAEILHVSPAALMGWDDPRRGAEDSPIIPFTEGFFAPIVGSIPAGYPALAAQDIEGYATIPYKDAENYFFLRVKGDSMVNAGIREGDLVLIRKQDCADNGQIVAALVNGDEATLKRYKQSGDTVVLLPENPAYDPQIVPSRDFISGQAQIIGVALEVRHTL